MAQPSGRILALDFGKRRIGLAISDALGYTALPLPTYMRVRVREDIAYLANFAREREVTVFVFGDPKYMSGDPSQQSKAVKEFAERLGEATKAKILAKIGYRGSTSADEAYSEIKKRFKRSDAPTKILIHLTDGEIESDDNSRNSKESVNNVIPELERDGVEIIVLTVGMTATQVRRLVGDHRADEVTDANIGQVLAKHLKRTIIT